MRLAHVALLVVCSILATLKTYTTLHGSSHWKAFAAATELPPPPPQPTLDQGIRKHWPPAEPLTAPPAANSTNETASATVSPVPAGEQRTSSGPHNTSTLAAPLTTADVLRLVLPALRTVAVPLGPPNSTAARNCTLPEVSAQTLRVRWQQPQEPMTAFYNRLLAAGVELYASGIAVPAAQRVPAVTFSTAPISVALPQWRPWWQPGGVAPPEPPAFVVVFRDVWVKSGWVLECRRAFTAGGCYQGPGDLQPITKPRHVARAFVLGDPWAHGYFHWTQEQMPRLAIMYDALQRDTSILIMAPFTGFATSFIVDVLGLNRSRLIGHAAEYHVGTAYYPSPMLCGHALLQPLLLLRRAVFARLNLTDVPPPSSHVTTVLFPLRNDSRQPLNHDALVAGCRRRFPAVRVWEQNFRGWPVRRQIEAFNSADVVVGPHGANLANMVYMRLWSTVVEFVPGRTGNPCYYGLAARLGLDYRMVVLADRAQGQPNEVPEAEVVRHLAAALKRGSRRPSPAP